MPNPPTPEELEGWEKMLAAMPAGALEVVAVEDEAEFPAKEWRCIPHPHWDVCFSVDGDQRNVACILTDHDEHSPKDREVVEFFAASPTIVAALLAEVKRLREENAKDVGTRCAGGTTDSERLIWIVANDAGFGTTGRFAGMQGGDPVWLDARFVRVPCRHLYEWHIYDGWNWRAAIDAAMKAEPCALAAGGRCKNSRFAPDEFDHPYEQALNELRGDRARMDHLAANGLSRETVDAWREEESRGTATPQASTNPLPADLRTPRTTPRL